MKIVKFYKENLLVFEKSSRKNKKYRVTIIKPNDEKQKIEFGDIRYKNYKDRIGLYSNLDHLDINRRQKYLARATKIKNKQGQLTSNIVFSPNWFSINFLW